MPEDHLLTYNGMPRYAHTLVECLEAEGLRVSWTPPVEDRGGVAEVLGSVVTAITVNGPETAVNAGVDRFRSSFPGKGRVQVEQADAA
jgi:hypothetical protein